MGPDGATHQAIEDIALMRPIANMTVLVPCDVEEARKVTLAAAKFVGPVYMRFAREKTPVFTTNETPFEIGKAQIFWDSIYGSRTSIDVSPDAPFDPAHGKRSGRPSLDVAIIACGPLTHNAILAAAELEREGIGIRVINNPSIKPMDEGTIIQAAKDAGAVVTVEEHQVAGGMGSAVAELLARTHPVPMEFIGVQDRFGESGNPNELIEHFGMGVSHIKTAIKKVIARKG